MSEKDNLEFNNFSVADEDDIVRKRAVFDESQLKEVDNPYQNSHAESAAAEKTQTEAPSEKKDENSESENAEKPKKKRKSVIVTVIMIFAIICFVLSGMIILKSIYDTKKNIKNNKELADSVNSIEDNTAVGADGIFEKYRALYNQNPDFVGWIRIPNTSINHPVVKGDTNDFYLHKGFDKSYDVKGSIFMDYRDHVDVLCKNTILYGHNNLDTTMFSDLEKYKDLEFYKTAPVIEFNTIYRNYKWKIIAVFYTNNLEKDDNDYALNYIYPFMTDDSFESYYAELMLRSLYFTGVDVVKTDKILTLSTCTRDMDIKGRGETDARFVVVARMVRNGEAEEVDTSKALSVASPKYPQVWYDAHGTQNPYLGSPRWYPEGVEY
ncbi:MAG: class B sortase [Ruminococcaceae bacterium]|nr:class B sortase [Oscillospiraceae bacterium]